MTVLNTRTNNRNEPAARKWDLKTNLLSHRSKTLEEPLKLTVKWEDMPNPESNLEEN